MKIDLAAKATARTRQQAEALRRAARADQDDGRLAVALLRLLCAASRDRRWSVLLRRGQQ